MSVAGQFDLFRAMLSHWGKATISAVYDVLAARLRELDAAPADPAVATKRDSAATQAPLAEKPPVKVPLLDLSVAVLVLAMSDGVVSDDAQAVNRFSGALQKAFAEQTSNRIHRGRGVTKQKDKLVAIWGNTPLSLQHQIVAIATQMAAAGELADLVGPLPEPELPPAPKKPPEAMF